MSVDRNDAIVRVGQLGGGCIALMPGGMGCAGLPENHPAHHFCVQEWRGSRSKEYEGAWSLDCALENPSWTPQPIRDAIRKLYADAGIGIEVSS